MAHCLRADFRLQAFLVCQSLQRTTKFNNVQPTACNRFNIYQAVMPALYQDFGFVAGEAVRVFLENFVIE